jgi:hypothetical protein
VLLWCYLVRFHVLQLLQITFSQQKPMLHQQNYDGTNHKKSDRKLDLP